MSLLSGPKSPVTKIAISSLANVEDLEDILRESRVKLVERLDDVVKLQLSVRDTKIKDGEMTNVYDNIGFNHQAFAVDWITTTASEATVSMYVHLLVAGAVVNHNARLRESSAQPLILQCNFSIGAHLLTANPAAAGTVMPPSPSDPEFVSPPSLPVGASASSCSTPSSSRWSVGSDYNYLDGGIVHRRNGIGLMTEAARPDSCLVYIEVKKELKSPKLTGDRLTGTSTKKGLAQLLGGLYDLCVQRLKRQQRETTEEKEKPKEGRIKVFGILTSFVRWIFVEFVMIWDADMKACEYRLFGDLDVPHLEFWLKSTGDVQMAESSSTADTIKAIENVCKHLKYILRRTDRESPPTKRTKKKRCEEELDSGTSSNTQSDQASSHQGDHQLGNPNPKKQKKE